MPIYTSFIELTIEAKSLSEAKERTAQIISSVKEASIQAVQENEQ